MTSLGSALNTAVGGLLAQGTVLATVADNIANLGTPGYKRAQATLVSGPAQIPQAFLRRDMSQGAIAPTGNPNDLAISGNGFFEVALPGGGIGYTRDGSFSVSASAVMIDQNGNPVIGPIALNPSGGPVTVSPDGVVSQTVGGGQQVLGRIATATFPNAGGLSPQSGNLFLPTTASGQPGTGAGGQIVQGAIEAPNVDLAQELVTMIAAKTVYRASAQVIRATNDMTKTLLAIA